MEILIQKIKQFAAYLWGKKSELTDMDEKDLLLSKVVLDIHRKRSHKTVEIVPLFHLLPIHPINREGSLTSTSQRIKILHDKQEELLTKKILTNEVLKECIPSISAIKAVRLSDDEIVAYEGNGRLAAMQEVFSSGDNISVEVEIYHFKRPRSIHRRIKRLRRLHKLDVGEPVIRP